MSGSAPSTLLEKLQTDRNTLLSAILVALKAALPTVFGSLATSATAGTATLPSQPAGFIVVPLPGGGTGKMPYYNT